MDRKIKLADLKSVVSQAYDKLKNDTKGQADPRVADMNPGKFGISVRLADGTKFDVGDTQAQFAMGALVRIPVMVQLLTQMRVEELVQKMGIAKCGCKCHGKPKDNGQQDKPKAHHKMALRSVSMVEPTGDPEGKMDIISNMMIGMMGSSPVLDDNLYKAAEKANAERDAVNALAAADFELYDAAAPTIDLYLKLRSMLVTTEQLAEMGATIAADGVNPVTNQIVFDGSISSTICSIMAAKGPKKMGRPWLIMTGTPAMSGFGGGFVAVLPGVGSIAAFSPELNEAGIPIKAALSIKDILDQLQLSAFSSAKVEFVD